MTVTVADVNSKPQWVATEGSIPENSPVGTVIMVVNCTDKNKYQDHTFTVDPPWDSYFDFKPVYPRLYASRPSTLPFLLSSLTEIPDEYYIMSAQLVVKLDALDYEGMGDANYTYMFSATVKDDGTLTESVLKTGTTDQFTTQVYNRYTTGSSPANTPQVATQTLSFRVTSVHAVPRISAVVQVQAFGLSTAGGEVITLNGVHFGSASLPRPQVAVGYPNLPYSVVPAAAFYVNKESNFTAIGCTITTSYVQAQCKSAPGFGFNHSWQILVRRKLSTLSRDHTFYASPNVVSFSSDSSGLTVEAGLSSSGNQSIYISGTQFGLVSQSSVALRNVTFGPTGLEYTARDCRVTVDHTQIVCTTVPSVGGGLRWQVNIGGQISKTPTTSTETPKISGIVLLGPMITDGGTDLFVVGSNFGTLNDPAYPGQPLARDQVDGVTYGDWDDAKNAWSRSYSAVGCRVNVSFTRIHCKTAPGSGTGLRWTVSIAGLVSLPSTYTTDYAPPTATSVVTDSGSPTAGGVRATLNGHNFGGPSDSQIILFDGITIQNPSYISFRQFQFQLPAGGGSQHNVSIIVRGQQSNNVSFAYDPPVLPSVAPLKYISGAYGSSIRIAVSGTNFGMCCFLRSRSVPNVASCPPPTMCDFEPLTIWLMNATGFVSQCM